MALAGGVIGLAAFSTASDMFLTRLNTLFAGDMADVQQSAGSLENQAIGSTNQRMLLLQDSIALTLKNPIFGVGPGTFEVGQQQAANSRGVRAAWRGTHNTYTQVSSEGGIPALVFFIAVIYYSIRDLRRVARLNASVADRNRGEASVALRTLEYLWWAHVVLFPFYHIGYSVAIPTLAGLTAALTQARAREIQVVQRKAERAAEPAPAEEARVPEPAYS